MKKLLATILSLALIFSLAACGSSNAESGSSGTDAPSSTEAPSNVTSSETPSTEPATDESETPSESEPSAQPEQGKTLVAYFSWSGNTQQLAGMIQEEVDGDLFEITPATPYTDDYDALLDQAQQEQRDNARPELANQVENWDDYDVIFVGYPNWWNDTPMAVLTFLESYDFTGKTLIPFCTHGSGGFGRSLSSVESSASGATVLDGFEVSGSSVGSAQSDVSSWIAGLQLSE